MLYTMSFFGKKTTKEDVGKKNHVVATGGKVDGAAHSPRAADADEEEEEGGGRGGGRRRAWQRMGVRMRAG